MEALAVLEDKILWTFESFASVVLSQAEVGWTLIADAGVLGVAPLVSWVAADFVALSVTEFISDLAPNSDAGTVDEAVSWAATGNNAVITLDLVTFRALR